LADGYVSPFCLEPVLNFLKKCLYIVNTSGHYAWDGEAKKTVSE
jgi:hypothetical protein